MELQSYLQITGTIQGVITVYTHKIPMTKTTRLVSEANTQHRATPTASHPDIRARVFTTKI